MSDFKNKINKVASKTISKGVEKNRARRSEPWLTHYSSQIAMRILSIIDDNELSQEDLAKILEVKPQQVSKIVKGQENLTLKTIYNLSTALDFDLLSFPEYSLSTEILYVSPQVLSTPIIKISDFKMAIQKPLQATGFNSEENGFTKTKVKIA